MNYAERQQEYLAALTDLLAARRDTRPDRQVEATIAAATLVIAYRLEGIMRSLDALYDKGS